MIENHENERFPDQVLIRYLNSFGFKLVSKPDPGHRATYLPRLGARGSGLGAGAGLILDYREMIF